MSLSIGARSEAVRFLQHRLGELGYLRAIDADGIFGEKTEAAVRAFQSDRGLKVDGIAGPITMAALAPQTVPVVPALDNLQIDNDGWLVGDGVIKIPSHPSWYYPRLNTGNPIAIVAHASATKLGTGVVMAEKRTRPRTDADRAASWHASIEVDHIVQQAPFLVGCWHALGVIKGAGAANRVGVGLELVGFEAGPWPLGQVGQAMRLWRALVVRYGIKRPLAMVPHAVIDPDRRSDPGKLWMETCAERVLDYAYL